MKQPEITLVGQRAMPAPGLSQAVARATESPAEQLRLAALHALGILDSAPEERFDRVTRLAIRLFAVPAALIVLVDTERHWIKSAAGPRAAELAVDGRIFHHSIQNDGILQVTDVTGDNRFAGRHSVAAPLRFYAACPLHSREGCRLGVLCLFDHVPRSLDAGALSAMRDLAAIVENEFSSLELASHDALTGIPNKRGFMLLAQQSVAFCARQGCTGSLVLLELAGLKSINDTLGRKEGNLALLVFADQLKKAFRGSDSYARLGAGQFAVFLANVTKEQARAVFVRFAEALQRYNREAARDYQLSYRNVIVEFSPGQDASLEQLLAQAEADLQQPHTAAAG